MMYTTLRKLALPLLVVLMLAGLGLALLYKPRVPDVTYSTLEGQTGNFRQLAGKVVLVNFWATTCPGCIAEMPELIKTYHEYHKKGFEIIAVAMAYDPPSHVANYARKQQLPFPIALDTDGALARAFDDVKLTPTAFIIDKEGHVVRSVVGTLDFTALRHYLDQELGRAGG